jgi:hypothetical protein
MSHLEFFIPVRRLAAITDRFRQLLQESIKFRDIFTPMMNTISAS